MVVGVGGSGVGPSCSLIWLVLWVKQPIPSILSISSWNSAGHLIEWTNLHGCVFFFFSLSSQTTPQVVIRPFPSGVRGLAEKKQYRIFITVPNWQLSIAGRTPLSLASRPAPGGRLRAASRGPEEPSLAVQFCSFLSLFLCGVRQGRVFLQEYPGCVACSPPLSHPAMTFPFRLLPCWWFSSLVQYFTFISIEFQLPSVPRGT